MAKSKTLLTKEEAKQVIELYRQLPKNKQLIMLGLVQGLAVGSKDDNNE